MDNKTDLREFAKELRKTLPIKEISKELVQKIKSDEVFINARNVMLYYPTKYEINLLDLINEDKNFYLPRVNGKEIEVCPYKLCDELIKSYFCILEPTCESVSANILDLVIVPALTADTKGYRLGYGCGFYDRFLKKHKVKTVCAIPNELFIEKLPTEDFDIPVDKVFTG